GVGEGDVQRRGVTVVAAAGGERAHAERCGRDDRDPCCVSMLHPSLPVRPCTVDPAAPRWTQPKSIRMLYQHFDRDLIEERTAKGQPWPIALPRRRTNRARNRPTSRTCRAPVAAPGPCSGRCGPRGRPARADGGACMTTWWTSAASRSSTV